MIGFVVRRLRGRLPLATAALLTVLITTAVLTTLVAFNREVGQAGLRRSLQGPGYSRTTVLVSGDRDLSSRAADDQAVRDFAGELFDRLPVSVQSVARSRSFGLPQPAGAAGDRQPDLTVLAALDRGRTRLLAGAWPQPPAGAGSPVETAVPQNALTGLGLAGSPLPATVQLTDRFTDKPLSVRITGVYEVADKDDPYWRLDPLGGHGVQVLGFTTYGPMLVDDAVFTGGTVPQAGRSWLVGARFDGVTQDDADGLRARVADVSAELQHRSAVQVNTELADLLGELKSSGLVTRSDLLVGALQLAVLAGAALLLVVHLLADRQAAENQLLAARGASRRRIGAFTAAEATLLALPAVLLAPPLTPQLLKLLTGHGPLAAAGLDTSLPWIAWPVALGCAVGCVLLATVPALLRSAGTVVLRRAGRRQATVSTLARSGADLALLVLAVVAYRQLSDYSGAADDNSLGVDPLLVAAPTLALCAGTVTVLRLLPFAARLGERLAARGSGLAPALAGWQFARRPGRGAGPVLLLVLAVSIGMLAIGQRSSWAASQDDQASFATAGGLRITGSALPAAGQGGAYGALPGGDRLIPVFRQQQTMPRGATATVLTLDAGRAADHLKVRPDLLDDTDPGQLFRPLTPGPGGGLVLPGLPQRIDLDVTSRILHRDGPPVGVLGLEPAPGPLPHPPTVSLLLRDAFGVPYRVPAPAIAEDGAQQIRVDLSALVGAPNGRAAGPLTLIGLRVDSPLLPDGGVTGELLIDRIAAADSPTGPATPVAAPDGLGWSLRGTERSSTITREGLEAAADGGHLLRLEYRTNFGGRGDHDSFDVTPKGGAAGIPPVPAVTGVATRSYLEAIGASVGQQIALPLGRAPIKVRIVAAVEALPTTTGPALAVDLAAVNRALTDKGETAVTPTEWWLPATGPGDSVPARAAAQLRDAPFAQTLQVRDEVAAELRDDPLGSAPQSALAALAVAAAALAAIGFAAASAGAAAERTGEFAVLMALGAPRRRLVRTVAAEQGVLALLGLGTGLALGTLLVHLVVPLVVLTPAAHRPLPDVLVHLPLTEVALLAAVIAAALVLPALLAGRRHRDLTARLRHQEEM